MTLSSTELSSVAHDKDDDNTIIINSSSIKELKVPYVFQSSSTSTSSECQEPRNTPCGFRQTQVFCISLGCLDAFMIMIPDHHIAASTLGLLSLVLVKCSIFKTDGSS